MKGVILNIARDVRIVDISHSVSPQDVMEAAHILAGAVRYYPEETVHLVVVDPGVGTGRRGIALRYRNQFFVGPDNGVFSLLLKRDVPDLVVELDRPEFWGSNEPSATFHGRDIFAPVAARLASGESLDRLGSVVDEIKAMHWALPITDDRGIQGWVVHVDGFGNCVTNITKETFEELHADRAFKCYAGNAILDHRHATYADAAPGDNVLLYNSEGVLEVAINRGNASELLGIRKGASVNIVFMDERSSDGHS